jgi:hypothetical protein
LRATVRLEELIAVLREHCRHPRRLVDADEQQVVIQLLDQLPSSDRIA